MQTEIQKPKIKKSKKQRGHGNYIPPQLHLLVKLNTGMSDGSPTTKIV